MQKRKKQALALVILLLMIFSLLLIACSNGGARASDEAKQPISINNDSVAFSDQGFVTDPDAGETVGTVTSGGVEFDSLGIAASPDSYAPPGNLESLTLGVSPAVPHGDTNGEQCLTCHETGAGGALVAPQSHLDNRLTDDYCRNCHSNA
jgi:hypothetical protein